MDLLAGLKDKLRFIERHYYAASEPFRETKRKIDVAEEPFAPPPFDPETDDLDEPPFLSEWIEAYESLNIEGQAALKLVSNALHEYLRSFAEVYKSRVPMRGRSWFERYKNHFLQAYGIDFDQSPIPLEELEEINLARNDAEHGGEAFGMTRRQSDEHLLRFPDGLFVEEIDRQMARSSSDAWPGRIFVTETGLKEAIRRVETFCKFIDAQRS